MLKLGFSVPSKVLLRPVRVEVAMPYGILAPAPPFSVIWGLHCALEGAEFFFDKLDCGSLVDQYGIAFIAPSLGNGWFINSTYEAHADFLEELFDFVPQYFPIAREAERNIALGVSMGAYGALRWAMTRYRFRAAVAIGGVLWPEKEADARINSIREQVAIYRICKKLLKKLRPESRMDEMPDLGALLAQHNAQESICYLYCGNEDYLALEQNREFYSLCAKLGQPCEFEILPGGHSRECWSKGLQCAFSKAALVTH